MPREPFHRQTAKQFSDRADLICRLIVGSDYPLIDIQIERGKLRDDAERLFPDRLEMYDYIYESRFDRLIEQFRETETEWY